MYGGDEELAFTGLGSLAIAGFVFEAYWLAVAALLLTAAGLMLVRVSAQRYKPRHNQRRR